MDKYLLMFFLLIAFSATVFFCNARIDVKDLLVLILVLCAKYTRLNAV